MGFLTMQSFSGMLEGGEPLMYEGQLVGAMRSVWREVF